MKPARSTHVSLHCVAGCNQRTLQCRDKPDDKLRSTNQSRQRRPGLPPGRQQEALRHRRRQGIRRRLPLVLLRLTRCCHHIAARLFRLATFYSFALCMFMY